ncbi:MAG: toxin-antitoxin system YwqK family antitoxin [Bacteroidota bacterium]
MVYSSFFTLSLRLLFSILVLDKKLEIASTDYSSSSEKISVVQANTLVLNPQEGLVYYQGLPFTGTSVSYFTNQEKATSIDYIDGKRHGRYIKWLDNGTKSFESNYKDGKRNGTTCTWWRNGNLRSKSNYESGIPNGIQQQWYVSGAKFKRMNLIDGKEHGLQQSWRENGKLYNNYEAKNGRIFGLKRAELCYELDNEIVQSK